jgi:hypothetical protein
MYRRPALQPYFRQIIMTLLTRMQQNKTNNYVYYFAYFLLYLLAINVDGLTPDFLIQTVDEIQSGYHDRFIACADQALTGVSHTGCGLKSRPTSSSRKSRS